MHQDSACPKLQRLEEIRGFLNYVVRTYPPLKLYLSGFHITIDGWRADKECFLDSVEFSEDDDDEAETGDQSHVPILSGPDSHAPRFVKTQPRLIDNIAPCKR